MEIVNLFSALLTPVIGVATISILILQYRLQRYKVKHELYEPRMKIYRSVRDFLQFVLHSGDASQEQISKLIEETSEAQFLFKGKIRRHIRDLSRHAVDIQMLNRQLNSKFPRAEDRLNELAKKQEDEFKWFMDQIEKTDKLFSKYVTLAK